MIELQTAQRALLADTLRDIANVAAGATVFGQFLADRAFSFWLALMGSTLWIGLVTFAVFLAGRRRP